MAKKQTKSIAKRAAAKKKAAAIPHPDSHLIASIAVRVRELARELKSVHTELACEMKSVHQKLDFCVATLDARRDSSQEPHPVVRAALKAMEGDGEGEGN